MLIKALLKGKERMITAKNFTFYLDWSNPGFIDSEEYDQPENKDRMGLLESAHNVLCFLFDFLQFGF